MSAGVLFLILLVECASGLLYLTHLDRKGGE